MLYVHSGPEPSHQPTGGCHHLSSHGRAVHGAILRRKQAEGNAPAAVWLAFPLLVLTGALCWVLVLLGGLVEEVDVGMEYGATTSIYISSGVPKCAHSRTSSSSPRRPLLVALPLRCGDVLALQCCSAIFCRHYHLSKQPGMWAFTHRPALLGIHYHSLRGPRRRMMTVPSAQPEPTIKHLDDGSILFTFDDRSASNGAAPAINPETIAPPQATATSPETTTMENLTEDVLRSMKVVELRNLAKERGTKISNFGKLRKDELIELLLRTIPS